MGPFRIKMKFFTILILFTSYLSAGANPLEETSTVSPGISVNDETPTPTTIEGKRAFIRNMTSSAWNAYAQHAWGEEALNALTKSEYHQHFGKASGHTIVSALSTLWTMELKDEFANGRKWVEEKLDFGNIYSFVSVHSTVTNYVGGLMSSYALSGDEMFLAKAKEVAQLTVPAYNTSTGLPYAEIIPGLSALSDPEPYLSQITFQQPELIYLSSKTNNSKVAERLQRIRKFMQEIEKSDGIYWRGIRVTKGKWNVAKTSTLFEQGRDFYQNMVNSYILSGGRDVSALEMYREAIDAMERNGMFGTSGSGLVYARNLDNSSMLHSLKQWMDYSGCYLGAMLSLGAESLKRELIKNVSIVDTERRVQQERIDRHWQLAKDLTETCHQAAVRTKTGLPPATFMFKHADDATNGLKQLSYYNLSPELAESYFILWRLTHDEKYRDYAWQMTLAIQKHCRTESSGFTSIKRVHESPAEKYDYQRAHFLAGTLKYLYLTFTDDTVLPLDKWVFNAAGHPLPICGKHETYPKDKC